MKKHEELIKQIRDHIDTKGQTYFNLQKEVNIDRSNIHRMMSGANIPRLDRFISIAEAAGFEVIVRLRKNNSKKVSK